MEETYNRKYFSQSWLDMYKAVAKYEAAALPILMKSIYKIEHNRIRSYHLDCMLEALSENTKLIYEEIYWNLWAEEKRLINLDVLRLLLKIDKNKAYFLAVRYFDKEPKASEKNISTEVDLFSQENTMKTYLLYFIHANDVELFEEIVFDELREAKRISIYSVVPMVNNRSKLKEVLNERLIVEQNIHYFIEIAELWLDFRDEQMNKELIDLIKEKSVFKEKWQKNKILTFLLHYGVILD